MQVSKSLKHLVRNPLSTFHTPTTGDAWRRVPVTYVTTTKDYSVPRGYQESMLGRAKAEGVDVRVVEVDTTYSMFLSGFWGRLWGMRGILEMGAGRLCFEVQE